MALGPVRNASPDAEPKVLSSEDLQRFCEYLYRYTGMQFGESKRYYIDRRVAERMAELGTTSFPVYFSHLRSSPAEIEQVINSFTVNETYFYREEHQLRCLGRSILPELIKGKAPGDKVRIWSLPCSTGEEPYSIALWLLENWAMVDAYNVEIIGSDIDTQALSDARAGEYGERALSKLPRSVLQGYFEPPASGGRKIIKDLRESVQFTEANLIDTATLASWGRFDVIFCRNVLIYFDEASRLAAAMNLYDALQPGGFVCLGHTESMARISDRFAVRRFEDAIVYQRPAKS